ncbi:hypothetical protein DITRI_Ditri11bG0061600 [Diplodiscus trichospermus]
MGFKEGIFVEPVRLSGGLTLWWKKEYKAEVLEMNKNLIDVRVVSNEKKEGGRVTFVYGTPIFEDRKVLWEYMKKKANNTRESNEEEWVGKLKERLHEVLRKEESYWHQKSEVKWLSVGNRNTKFFHQTTIQRRQRNKILRIKADDREFIDSEEHIMNEFVKFYEELFKTSGKNDCGDILDCVPLLVKEEDNKVLPAEVADKEIKDVVFQLGAIPNGFNGSFY